MSIGDKFIKAIREGKVEGFSVDPENPATGELFNSVMFTPAGEQKCTN